jgi:hypothetical protein
MVSTRAARVTTRAGGATSPHPVVSESRILVCFVIALVLASAAHAVAVDPRATLFDGTDGATCHYFNTGARIPWRHQAGDWLDSTGAEQGDKPFAIAHIEPSTSIVHWDVTDLVRRWMDGDLSGSALLLGFARGAPAGTTAFASRNHSDAGLRPQLTVAFADGSPDISLAPSADTTLDCSTVASLGGRSSLVVSDDKHVALAFEFERLARKPVRRATLQMASVHSEGPADIAIYGLDPPVARPPRSEQVGLATRYPGDRNIDRDPDVVFATGFESLFWRSEWSYVSVGSHAEAITQDQERKFVPLQGAALRVTIPKGGNLGLDMGFNFADQLGNEPEEIYFRYYIRFSDDWISSVDGGKLPGPAGTYGRAGWGGRKANAREGWSLRGAFLRTPSNTNPLHNRISIGTYAYHAGGQDFFGDEWDWNLATQLLERNRWYCLEQHVKVNTPTVRDGVLEAWIDGVLAFDKRELYLRDTPDIKIEKVWMNVYHGGTAKAARDLDLYIDNVVVARRRIGCVSL